MRKITLILILFLVGCTTTKYHKWEEFNRSGFKETKITKTTYRVLYQGLGSNTEDDVYAFFLRRAAELAKKNGYKFLKIEDGKAGSKLNAVVTWPNYSGSITFLSKKESNAFEIKDLLN